MTNGRTTKASKHQMSTPVSIRGSMVVRQRTCKAWSTAPPSFNTSPPQPRTPFLLTVMRRYNYKYTCMCVLCVSIPYELPGTNSLPHLGTLIPLFGLARLRQTELLDRLRFVSGGIKGFGPDYSNSIPFGEWLQTDRQTHTDRHHQHWRRRAPAYWFRQFIQVARDSGVV